ncbi:MAG: glycosyltransferase family 4 protein [Verrucomicrobia bacterium]|nr:glycosyltransferase family 4 protein [Verrucomicrobiota bacterium]
MRIAFVSTILHYPWGGADALWTKTAARALAEGHAVFLAVSPRTAAHPQIQSLVQAGATLHLREKLTTYNGNRAVWGQRLARWLRRPSSLQAALDAFAPDHVLINQGGLFDFLLETGLMAWLRHENVPYTLFCQSGADTDTLDPQLQPTAWSCADRAHAFGFTSTHNRQLVERLLGHRLSNARIVENPVSLGFPVPLPWPSENRWRMAVVARLENRDKALDLLLQAVADVLAGEQNWQLSLFGRGSDEAALKHLTHELGLDDRVVFQGFSNDLRSIWQDHHLLLLPSRREGCAIAMLEALFCGRPVLATPVGGVSDWLKDGSNAFLAPVCDRAGIGAALRKAWDQRNQWSLMGHAASQTTSQMDPTPERTLLNVITGPAQRAVA